MYYEILEQSLRNRYYYLIEGDLPIFLAWELAFYCLVLLTLFFSIGIFLKGGVEKAGQATCEELVGKVKENI